MFSPRAVWRSYNHWTGIHHVSQRRQILSHRSSDDQGEHICWCPPVVCIIVCSVCKVCFEHHSKAPSCVITAWIRTARGTCWETWRADSSCCCWRKRSWWTEPWCSKTCMWSCWERCVRAALYCCTILQYTTLHYTELHYTTLHWTGLEIATILVTYAPEM